MFTFLIHGSGSSFHVFQLLPASMASRTRLHSSNADFLLHYMEEMSDLSGSEDKFEGYLDPENGPVAYCCEADYEDKTPLRRSQSLDNLPESLLAGSSPSLSPMQGEHASGSPLRMSSPSLSSPQDTCAVAAGPSPAASLMSQVYEFTTAVI